jgi:uncharacterized protein YndB with AHSA1/START domain
MNTLDNNTAYEISKVFPATQEQLFNAFTDGATLKKIWGVQSINVDPRVGGITNARYVVGKQNWSFTITYLEIVSNQKLRWITHFESFPSKETRVTLLFKKADRGVELVVRMENFETLQERDNNKQAWERALKTLEGLLAQQ